MTTFEIILCCVLIPIAFILSYIAGKHDLIGMIGKMLEEKTEELEKRKFEQTINKYSFLRDNQELLYKANTQGYLSGLDFSVCMHNFLISEDGYVIDTGNYENVNAEVVLRLARKIKDNPQLWQFFMVA